MTATPTRARREILGDAQDDSNLNPMRFGHAGPIVRGTCRSKNPNEIHPKTCRVNNCGPQVLAVLFDRDKSVSPDAQVGISRISDDEMARINIEASAALAEWIDILHTDFAEYLDLVDRAIAYLPLVHRTATPMDGHIMALASPEIAGQLIGASDPALLTRVRADADRHPNRLLANALMNVAWRNGPVEDVHAGKSWSCPLDQRRVTPAEERRIIRFASDRLAMGMNACHRFMAEQPRRPWSEQVLPFGLTSFLLITPSNWTLTDNSRDVHLPLSPTSSASESQGRKSEPETVTLTIAIAARQDEVLCGHSTVTRQRISTGRLKIRFRSASARRAFDGVTGAPYR